MYKSYINYKNENLRNCIKFARTVMQNREKNRKDYNEWLNVNIGTVKD